MLRNIRQAGGSAEPAERCHGMLPHRPHLICPAFYGGGDAASDSVVRAKQPEGGVVEPDRPDGWHHRGMIRHVLHRLRDRDILLLKQAVGPKQLRTSRRCEWVWQCSSIGVTYRAPFSVQTVHTKQCTAWAAYLLLKMHSQALCPSLWWLRVIADVAHIDNTADVRRCRRVRLRRNIK